MSSFFNNNIPLQKKTSRLQKLEKGGTFEDIVNANNAFADGMYNGSEYKSLTSILRKRPSNTSMKLGNSIKRRLADVHLPDIPLMQPTFEIDHSDF